MSWWRPMRQRRVSNGLKFARWPETPWMNANFASCLLCMCKYICSLTCQNNFVRQWNGCGFGSSSSSAAKWQNKQWCSFKIIDCWAHGIAVRLLQYSRCFCSALYIYALNMLTWYQRNMWTESSLPAVWYSGPPLLIWLCAWERLEVRAHYWPP